MALKMTKSDGSGGALRRRPLLPDDAYIDARIGSVDLEEVDDKFNGGKKKVITFSMELLKFIDPQSDDGEPRRVRLRVNAPKEGRGVHEKSNLFKFVKVVCGGDPWERNSNFDLEDMNKKVLRILMGTSDPIEQEVEEADGSVHTVNDYQYQWVQSWKTTTDKRADEVAPVVEDVEVEEEEEEEEDDEVEEGASDEAIEALITGLKAKAKSAAGKKKVQAALKKNGVTNPSEIKTASAEVVEAIAKALKIELPSGDESDDDLSFLE